MAYTNPERNYDGVMFGDFRSEFDAVYHTIHDDLSACYYEGRPWRNLGVLTKEEFDELHRMLYEVWDFMFHAENQASADPIPEARYNIHTEYDENGQLTDETPRSEHSYAKLKDIGRRQYLNALYAAALDAGLDVGALQARLIADGIL